MFKGINRDILSVYCLKLPVTVFLLNVSEFASANLAVPPRLSANAYASDHTVGQADLMLPLQGDSAHNFYVDPVLSYATNNQGYADLGVGYRWIQNKAAILGGYVFGGYSRIDNNARLWVVNPGIEALGSRWDAHLNAYLPMGDRHLLTAVSAPYFTGHREVADVARQFVGYGADVKLGYQLFPQSSLKGYLGSYFFTPAQSKNIWGGAAGLEYWLDKSMKITGNYTYDKVNQSTYALGLGIELGGTHDHRVSPALEERITDPVERALAGTGRGSAIPSTRKQFPGGLTLRNNIAFFSQSGGPNTGGLDITAANCTFETPCGPTDFSQTGVDSLNALLPQTTMLFNGGTYGQETSPVALHIGQSMTSTSADFTGSATGTARSTIAAPITLTGANTVTDMILRGSPGATDTRLTSASGANSVSGTNIISTANTVRLVDIQSGSTIAISNSILQTKSGTALSVTGAADVTGSTLTTDFTGLFRATVDINFGGVATIVDSTITDNGITDNHVVVSRGALRILSTSVTGNNGVAASVLKTGNAFASISVEGHSNLTLIGPGPGTITDTTFGGTITISPSTVCTINVASVMCP